MNQTKVLTNAVEILSCRLLWYVMRMIGVDFLLGNLRSTLPSICQTQAIYSHSIQGNVTVLFFTKTKPDLVIHIQIKSESNGNSRAVWLRDSIFYG